MKKLKNYLTSIRDLFIVLGIPGVMYYAHDIHKEQINSKNYQIELLERRAEELESLQIERALVRIKAQKEFYDMELKELESNLTTSNSLNDSLLSKLNEPIKLDSTHIILNAGQIKKVLLKFVEAEQDSHLLAISEQEIKYLKFAIDIDDKIIVTMKEQIKGLHEIIKNQEKIIEIQN